VGDIGEAVLLGQPFSPPFDCGAVNFDRATTVATHQVVVVVGGAAAIASLAVVWSQHVNLTGLGHRLQGAVHRRETNT
jgi:hypothetical protein